MTAPLVCSLQGNSWNDSSKKSLSSLGRTIQDYLKNYLAEEKDISVLRNIYPTVIREVERPLIMIVLRESKGNQTKAAQLLGMNRNTLRKKIIELNISH